MRKNNAKTHSIQSFLKYKTSLRGGDAMKKVVCLLCVISILLIMSVSIFANIPATKYLIVNDGKQLFSNEEVFVENDMIYLPLEELLSKLEFTKKPYNYLHVEDNKFALYFYGANTSDVYNMEIGNNQIVYTQSPVTYSPATRETVYAPVLKNNLIYIPFEYIHYIFNMTGLYHIEMKSSIEQNVKNPDDALSANELTDNIFNTWIIGGFIILLLFAFIIGYCIGKKNKHIYENNI